MLLYAAIMFAVAILFLSVSVAIYRGRTDLIHSYHQERVKDKAAYGRAFGRAMAPIWLGLLASGAISLLGEDPCVVICAISALLAGLILGVACILAVQRRYNRGLF